MKHGREIWEVTEPNDTVTLNSLTPSTMACERHGQLQAIAALW